MDTTTNPREMSPCSKSSDRVDFSETAGAPSAIAPQQPMSHRLTIATEVLNRVNRALEQIRAGRMLIRVDDEDRENEGDLCMAAELVTPEAVNFMARYGRGLICLTLDEEQVHRLELPMMTAPGLA